jgi:hypothetical protein
MKTTKPETSIKGLTFYPLPEVSDVEVAIGFSASRYFNRYDLPDVPGEHERVVSKLFFDGGKIPKLQDGVDRDHATKLIRAWLCSFAPAHEAKITTAAYALWVWTSADLEQAEQRHSCGRVA